MIIDSLERAVVSGRARLSARVRHEDSDHPPHEVYFDVDERHAHAIAEGYEAVTLAMMPVAHAHGEARLHVDGPLCPLLTEHLRSALGLLRRWDPSDRPVATVSARVARVLPVPPSGVATFTSGGVDSTYNLVTNARTFAPGDPRRIDTAILVDGLDINDPNLARCDDLLEHATRTLEAFVASYGCALVGVRTNLRTVAPGESFYGPRQIGSALAGIAHALGGRVGTCHLSLESPVDRWAPYGSDPWLNGYLSSSGVRIVSRGDGLRRLDKYSAVLDEPGFATMFRACGRPADAPAGTLNCGRCSKCLRVQLELLAHGRQLDEFSFPHDALTAARLRGVRPRIAKEAEYLIDVPDGLRAHGYEEYVAIVEDLLASMRRPKPGRLRVLLSAGRRRARTARRRARDLRPPGAGEARSAGADERQ